MELLTAAFKGGWSNVIIHMSFEKKEKEKEGKKEILIKGSVQEANLVK